MAEKLLREIPMNDENLDRDTNYNIDLSLVRWAC